MNVKNPYEGSIVSLSEFQKFDQSLLKEFEASTVNNLNKQQLQNLKAQAVQEICAQKLNYKKQEYEKKMKQKQFTGSLKHLRGKSGSPVKNNSNILNELKIQDDEQSVSPQKFSLNTDQVQELIRTKYKKIVQNNMEKQINEKTSEMNNLIDIFQKDIEYLDIETEVLNNDLEEILKSKVRCSQPGQKLEKLMEKWQDEQILNYEQNLSQYDAGPWKSLEEIEKMILREERSYMILLKNKEFLYNNRIQQIKLQCQHKIQALETALIEQKLIYMRKIERYEMTLAEAESKRLYQIEQISSSNQFLDQIENEIKFKSVKEARQVVDQLVSLAKSQNEEIDRQNQFLENQKKQIESYNSRIEDRELQYCEQQRLREFYQNIVLKFVNELNLYESQNENQKIIACINEQENDLQYQRHSQIVLQHLDIHKIIDRHICLHMNLLQGRDSVSSNKEIVKEFYKEMLSLDKKKKEKPHLKIIQENFDKENLKKLIQVFGKILGMVSEQKKQIEKGVKPVKKVSNQKQQMIDMISKIDPYELNDFRFQNSNVLETKALEKLQQQQILKSEKESLLIQIDQINQDKNFELQQCEENNQQNEIIVQKKSQKKTKKKSKKQVIQDYNQKQEILNLENSQVKTEEIKHKPKEKKESPKRSISQYLNAFQRNKNEKEISIPQVKKISQIEIENPQVIIEEKIQAPIEISDSFSISLNEQSDEMSERQSINQNIHKFSQIEKVEEVEEISFDSSKTVKSVSSDSEYLFKPQLQQNSVQQTQVPQKLISKQDIDIKSPPKKNPQRKLGNLQSVSISSNNNALKKLQTLRNPSVNRQNQYISKQNKKVCVDKEVQVDFFNKDNQSQGSSFYKQFLTPRTNLLNIIKQHLISIIQKNIVLEADQQFMIEEMDAGQILNYSLGNIYQNQAYEEQGIHLTFEGYLHCVFDSIKHTIEKKKEKRIFLNELFQIKSSKKQTKSQLVQTSVQTKNMQIQATPSTKSIMSGTGFELVNAYLGERGDLIIKKTELSFAADKELEYEFQNTLKIMDDFASQILNIESDSYRKINCKNIQNNLLTETKTIFDNDYEKEQRILDLKKEKFQLEDKIQKINFEIGEIKDQKYQHAIDFNEKGITQKIFQLKKIQANLLQTKNLFKNKQSKDNEKNYIQNNISIQLNNFEEVQKEHLKKDQMRQKMNSILKLQIQQNHSEIEKFDQNEPSLQSQILVTNNSEILEQNDWVFSLIQEQKEDQEKQNQFSKYCQSKFQQFAAKKPKINQNIDKTFESTKISSDKHNKIFNISDQFVYAEDINSNENQLQSRITGYVNKIESKNHISNLRNSIQEQNSKLSVDKQVFLEFNMNQQFQSQNQSPVGFRLNQNFLDQMNKTQSYNFPGMKLLQNSTKQKIDKSNNKYTSMDKYKQDQQEIKRRFKDLVSESQEDTNLNSFLPKQILSKNPKFPQPSNSLITSVSYSDSNIF